MKSIGSIAAAGIIVAATCSLARAAGEESRLEVLRTGKSKFEQTCKFCHSLERSLTKNKSREEWSQTVKRMVTYGAPLNSVQREAVTSYLAARSTFEKSCNSCHSSLRVLAGPVQGRDWKATVERMDAHLEGLGKEDAEMRQLSPAEVEDIAALLTLVIPAD